MVYFNEKTSLKSTLSYQRTEAKALLDSLKEYSENTPYYRSVQGENKVSITSVVKHKMSSKDNFHIGFVADLYNVNFADSVKVSYQDEFLILANDEGTLALIRSFGQFQHKFKR